MAIWDAEHECMDRERLEVLQAQRLRELTERVRERVPFYRERFAGAGFEPGDVTELDDILGLPFTEKTDFRREYPSGMFAVPGHEVVEVHSTSGTTGKPVVCGFTAADLETWAELVCRLAVAVGVGSDDVAQVTLGYGMFTGGFGLHYGLQRAGAQVLPVSSGNTERQIRFMCDLGTTVLIATPTYALHLGDVLRDSGVSAEELELRLGLFGAEACTEEMRRHIESLLPLVATDNYGLTEVLGPGVAGECECRSGMHVNEDHFVVECLDLDTGRPVPDGELGELVFTSLTRECSPVLRYRTHDISSVTRAALRVRPHQRAHRQGRRPDRRDVHRQRSERLSVGRREGALRHGRRASVLSDRARAPGWAGHLRGAGRGRRRASSRGRASPCSRSSRRPRLSSRTP